MRHGCARTQPSKGPVREERSRFAGRSLRDMKRLGGAASPRKHGFRCAVQPHDSAQSELGNSVGTSIVTTDDEVDA